MTFTAFQPNAFQPNAFQIGPLQMGPGPQGGGSAKMVTPPDVESVLIDSHRAKIRPLTGHDASFE